MESTKLNELYQLTYDFYWLADYEGSDKDKKDILKKIQVILQENMGLNECCKDSANGFRCNFEGEPDELIKISNLVANCILIGRVLSEKNIKTMFKLISKPFYI
jgi:hypothetical protein